MEFLSTVQSSQAQSPASLNARVDNFPSDNNNHLEKEMKTFNSNLTIKCTNEVSVNGSARSETANEMDEPKADNGNKSKNLSNLSTGSNSKARSILKKNCVRNIFKDPVSKKNKKLPGPETKSGVPKKKKLQQDKKVANCAKVKEQTKKGNVKAKEETLQCDNTSKGKGPKKRKSVNQEPDNSGQQTMKDKKNNIVEETNFGDSQTTALTNPVIVLPQGMLVGSLSTIESDQTEESKAQQEPAPVAGSGDSNNVEILALNLRLDSFEKRFDDCLREIGAIRMTMEDFKKEMSEMAELFSEVSRRLFFSCENGSVIIGNKSVPNTSKNPDLVQKFLNEAASTYSISHDDDQQTDTDPTRSKDYWLEADNNAAAPGVGEVSDEEKKPEVKVQDISSDFEVQDISPGYEEPLQYKAFLVDDDEFVHVYTNNISKNMAVWFGENHDMNWDKTLDGNEVTNFDEIQAARIAIGHAGIAGLQKLKIHTHSNYLINCMTKWITKWKENGWIDVSTGHKVKNKAGLKELDKAISLLTEVAWEKEPCRHVKKHATDPSKAGNAPIILDLPASEAIIRRRRRTFPKEHRRPQRDRKQHGVLADTGGTSGMGDMAPHTSQSNRKAPYSILYPRSKTQRK